MSCKWSGTGVSVTAKDGTLSTGSKGERATFVSVRKGTESMTVSSVSIREESLYVRMESLMARIY